MHNTGMGLRPYNINALLEPKEIAEEHALQQTELKWGEYQRDNKMFLTSIGPETGRRTFSAERSCSDLSIGVGLQGEKGNIGSSFAEVRFKEDDSFQDQTIKRADSVKFENEKLSPGYRLSYFTTKLDLNSRDEIDAASNCKQLDLNGFSWN